MGKRHVKSRTQNLQYESLFTREVNNVPVLPKSPYRDILPMVFKVHLFRSKKKLVGLINFLLALFMSLH